MIQKISDFYKYYLRIIKMITNLHRRPLFVNWTSYLNFNKLADLNIKIEQKKIIIKLNKYINGALQR